MAKNGKKAGKGFAKVVADNAGVRGHKLRKMGNYLRKGPKRP